MQIRRGERSCAGAVAGDGVSITLHYSPGPHRHVSRVPCNESIVHHTSVQPSTGSMVTVSTVNDKMSRLLSDNDTGQVPIIAAINKCNCYSQFEEL